MKVKRNYAVPGFMVVLVLLALGLVAVSRPGGVSFSCGMDPIVIGNLAGGVGSDGGQVDRQPDGDGSVEHSDSPALTCSAEFANAVGVAVNCEVWFVYNASLVYDSLPPNCKAVREFVKLDELKSDGGFRCLVAMLESDTPRFQWLGAHALNESGAAELHKRDKEFANTLLSVIAKSETDIVIQEIARSIAQVDWVSVGDWARVASLMKTHSNTVVRMKLVLAGQQFPNSFDVYYLLAHTDKDPGVRADSVGMVWERAPEARQGEVIGMYVTLADDTNEEVAAASVLECSTHSECASHYIDMLALMERRAKAGKIDSLRWANVPRQVYSQSKSAVVRKRAITSAKLTVENVQNNAIVRAYHLGFVVDVAPDGKSFAKRFLNDEWLSVRIAAQKNVGGR